MRISGSPETLVPFFFAFRLTDITIPDSVISIGNDAFCRCDRLTEITVPDSVTWIDGYAFSACKGLMQLTIPVYVNEVGDAVFTQCDNLTDIYNLSPVPQKSDKNKSVYGTLDGKENLKLHVYQGFKADYEASDRWNKVTIVDDIPLVPITSIELPTDIYVPYVYNGTGFIHPVIKPENASIKRLQWTYPNGNYCAVPFTFYADGKYTIYRKGDTELTATALDKSGATATVKVHVGEEAPSGINETHQEIAGQPVAIYSLNGTRLRSNARGIMLKRMPDGTVRKTIR